MPIELLFIEDNPHKRTRVSEFLSSGLSFDLNVTEAHSFTSGCQKFESLAFALVIADISLPTYDKEGVESGGKFRPFAGREIGRKIFRRGGSEKIIFVTQYKSFSDRGTSYSFDELEGILRRECGPHFGGMIYYDSSQYSWKEELEKSVQAAIG